jgi:CHAT domain-containing protein/tetratricopeptide (TPR) repeat protein
VRPLRAIAAVACIALSFGSVSATQDDKRAAADRALREGLRLRSSGADGSLQQSIEKAQEARQLFHAIGDRDGEEVALSLLGTVAAQLGDFPRAREAFGEALVIARASADRYGEAFILTQLAVVFRALGDSAQALESLTRALPLYQATGDRRSEAFAQNSLGALHLEAGHPAKAKDHYSQALTLIRAMGDREAEAATLINLGFVHKFAGEPARAADFYEQALTIARSAADRHGEASALNSLAALYSALGQKRRAVETYGQALSISRAAVDRPVEAIALNNLGAVYDDLGELTRALGCYMDALTLIRALGDRSGEAKALSNIGRVNDRLGERQRALDYYAQSLEIARAIHDRSTEATTLNNIGGLYSDLGQSARALDLYTAARDLYRASADRDGEATTLSNIGVIQRRQGEFQEALRSYEQALELFRALEDRAGQATSLNNLARVFEELGDSPRSLDTYNEALGLYREVGNRQGEANTLNNLGSVHADRGRLEIGLGFHQRALALCKEAGDVEGEAASLAALAWVERDLDRLEAARDHVSAALKIMEGLRGKIVSPELRTAYFADASALYAFDVDVLMSLHQRQPDAGYDRLALTASEAGRARGLLDLLTEAGGGVREGIDPALLEREQDLARRLNAAAVLRARAVAGSTTDAGRAEIERGLRDLDAEFDRVEAEIRQKSPHYASLTQPAPLAAAEIQRLLDADSVLLEFSLGSERSHLWVVSPTAIRSIELPGRERIRAGVREVRQMLTSPGRRVEPDPAAFAETLKQFSTMILGGTAAELAGKRLVIVADGELNLIPFGALPDPGDVVPLIVRHEIVNLPSASALAVLRRETARRPVAPRLAAVLADPVFSADDDRVKAQPTAMVSTRETAAPVDGLSLAGGSFPRLPHTREEQAAIAAAAPAAQIRFGLDFDASRAAAMSPDLADYRYVHFATHGIVDTEYPELSGLVLSLVDRQGQPVNGFLRLRDIFNLHFRADLVVLSACETALGRQMKGEGVVGLTRGFMYAGAARVVASLWRVDDASTAALMKRFYEGLVKGQRAAEALRAAQIAMWRSTDAWQQPYYWAAFTLQGDWR